MPSLSNIPVDLSAMIGTARMPLGELVKLGRGAVIPLGVTPDDHVALYAAGQALAVGELTVTGDRIAVTITHLLREHA